VKIGGQAPVSIQSMTTTDTSDVKATVAQIRRLEEAGCEIVRVAIKDNADAGAVRLIRRAIKIPLVCDIHYDHRLALACIGYGADKIRLNPGNIKGRGEIEAVARAAQKAKIPLRIGVNSGSAGSSAPSALVKAAEDCVKIIEETGFRDIIISLKASDVVSTVEAYRMMAARCRYPLHLGVTAAGPRDGGIVKSSIGIGSLLLGGIGDTVRVSLTADPVEEVRAARRILGSLGLRNFGPEIISCPTCGRCKVDLIRIVGEFDRAIRNTRYAIRGRPFSIAIMGCEVNGPGEAKEADIGVAFGRGAGVIFKKGRIIKRVTAANAVGELMRELR
jgi:(E)-4-hydroxy-3-methylbut-2-enyl-diphosphate synthase